MSGPSPLCFWSSCGCPSLSSSSCFLAITYVRENDDADDVWAHFPFLWCIPIDFRTRRKKLETSKWKKSWRPWIGARSTLLFLFRFVGYCDGNRTGQKDGGKLENIISNYLFGFDVWGPQSLPITRPIFRFFLFSSSVLEKVSCHRLMEDVCR